MVIGEESLLLCVRFAGAHETRRARVFLYVDVDLRMSVGRDDISEMRHTLDARALSLSSRECTSIADKVRMVCGIAF